MISDLLQAISKIDSSVLSSSFSWLLVGEKPAKAGTQNSVTDF
jgi:hypothetical protein